MFQLLSRNCLHYMASSKAAAWLTHCQSYRRVYEVHCITVVTQYNLICCVRDVWNTVICFVRVYTVKCKADVFHFGNLEESEWKSQRKFSIRFPSVVSVPWKWSTSDSLRRSFQHLLHNAISYIKTAVSLGSIFNWTLCT